MGKHLLYLLYALIVVGCAGQQGTGEPGDAKNEQEPGQVEKAEPAANPGNPLTVDPSAEPAQMAQGPDGEMIPGMFKAAEGQADAKGGESLPQGRLGLMQAAQRALDGGQLDEAVAIADTLVILYPMDADILELRAIVLDKKGDKEQAAADRAKCCELGRKVCCPEAGEVKDASD